MKNVQVKTTVRAKKPLIPASPGFFDRVKKHPAYVVIAAIFSTLVVFVGFFDSATSIADRLTQLVPSETSHEDETSPLPVVLPQPSAPAENTSLRITLADGTVFLAIPSVQFQVFNAPLAVASIDGDNEMIKKTIADTAANEVLRLSASLSREQFLMLRPEIEDQVAKNMKPAFELRGIRIYAVNIGEIWE